MQKSFCDRCGGEIQSSDRGCASLTYLKIPLNTSSTTPEMQLQPHSEDLCGECSGKMFKVLDEITKK